LDLVFLSSFLNLIFFSISAFNIVLVGDLRLLFFHFLSMDLSRPHVPGHEFSEFTKVDSGFFMLFYFFYFAPSKLNSFDNEAS